MSDLWQPVKALVDAAASQPVAPSAVVLVGRGRERIFSYACGRPWKDRDEVATTATVFDVSSLTKPLVTTALCMQLVGGGDLDPDARVDDLLPSAHGTPLAKAGVRVRHLLAHSSGLPAHRPYYLELERYQRTAGRDSPGGLQARRWITARALQERLEQPPGAQACYSDVGFIILGALVEHVAGGRLDQLFAQRIAGPLSLASARFGEVGTGDVSSAPCGQCPWRKRRIRGEVQDENAWAMGGVAGHAGLFASAIDVHGIAAELVQAWRGEPSLFDAEVVRRFWRRDAETPSSTWALGWDTPSAKGSSAGANVASLAVGHLGFTGTSLWIDLERGVHVVFLTNRLEIAGSQARLRALRPRLHDAVWRAADAGG